MLVGALLGRLLDQMCQGGLIAICWQEFFLWWALPLVVCLDLKHLTCICAGLPQARHGILVSMSCCLEISCFPSTSAMSLCP